MCTLSWMTRPDGYEVLFNRDEQKSRLRADLPQGFVVAGAHVLMPVDPQGGGTWLSTNQYGVTLALLNYYQGAMPAGELLSRGVLVKALSGARDAEDAAQLLSSQPISHFAPFSLLCFCPLSLRAGRGVNLYCWDGERTTRHLAESPMVSSAKYFDEVLRARRECYLGKVGDAASRQKLLDFHFSHGGAPSATSVCMHREDAHTVSLSHIMVADKSVIYDYYDGAPCSGVVPVRSELGRH
ncbi:NRDE family protein [Teredinibacter turnerae]|uniref:NRDE family protein n=1 Tax=Teredinibacter turnerae TaxID=2426 RepID=UPI00036F3811|nr:NRDE family protein [Teredinibacter turnerae]